MRTQDFDFNLPEQLIAQHPASERSASRLLHLSKDKLQDKQFLDLPSLLTSGDLLVLNNTRVIKARLFGQKTTGGQVEVLIERVLDEHTAFAQIRASRSPKVGSELILDSAIHVKVVDRKDDLFKLSFLHQNSVLSLLETHGELPLPPYINHAADQTDEQRYQTVFSQKPGAVAAPTAGLHFTEAMLETIRQKGIKIAYITLHVGAGTFQPVRVENISDHKMHSERYEVPPETAALIQKTKQNQGKVVAVGTTVLRALESAARDADGASLVKTGQGETDIFITPGFSFKLVDKLFTNFHLPKSTLLMLVSAFGGVDAIRAAYLHAINESYRFFSYGDAMLIERRDEKC